MIRANKSSNVFPPPESVYLNLKAVWAGGENPRLVEGHLHDTQKLQPIELDMPKPSFFVVVGGELSKFSKKLTFQ